jgi:hypothetical protein
MDMATTTHHKEPAMTTTKNVITGDRFAARRGFSGFIIVRMDDDVTVDIAVTSGQAAQLVKKYDRKRSI